MLFTRASVIGQRSMMRGPPRFMRDQFGRQSTAAFSFWFTPAQMTTFEQFYWETADAGQNQVAMTLWTNVGQATLTFWLSPYRWNFDSTLHACEVSFEGKYWPPSSSLLSVMLV